MSSDTSGLKELDAAIVNVAAYRFVPLSDLADWRTCIRREALARQLRGTVLLSREGINLFVAGTRGQVDGFLDWLRGHEPFAGLEVKESPGDDQPFNRMLVRIKKEIIALGDPGIDPVARPSPKLSPRALKQWLDEGRAVTLLDTRNDYEVALGTFHGAIPAGISHFRQFPDAVRQLPAELKRQPVVMFCTGGIRCEKAGPVMQQQGFEQVWQLDGGILKYFEECGGAHYQGDCFVFDRRVAVDPALKETGCALCFACRAVLTPEQQRDARYQPPDACPNCFRDDQQQLRDRLAARQAALDRSICPLPGSEPWTNIRPLNVPLKFDQSTVLDLLTGMHPHLGEEYWSRECRAGRLLCEDRVLTAETIVRAGWRIGHVEPHSVEPPVNAAIRLLHEDDALVVVDKPAPLPMHPCGRFHRNTLVWMLNRVYAPEVLRPAHRLDANTSGVVVLSRSRAIARKLQPQFESGAVEKLYLARVHGRPDWSAFRCDAPIGRDAIASGARRVDPDGLPAATLFRVIGHPAPGETLIECRPLTGRTNQIRLHLASLGFPIVGDPVYGLTDAGEESKAACLNAGSPCSAGIPDEQPDKRSLPPSSKLVPVFPEPVCGEGPGEGAAAGATPVHVSATKIEPESTEIGREKPDPTATLGLDCPRMCLHSSSISFLHPASSSRVTFHSPPPAWEFLD